MINRSHLLAAGLYLVAAAPGLADNACTASTRVIDQRSAAQAEADRSGGRLRCVRFVVSNPPSEPGQGWVEWIESHSGQTGTLHRLGLIGDRDRDSMVFGRLPKSLPNNERWISLAVLLDRPRWWLVNFTRQGWQLRSGTVSDPNEGTLRKLFQDVALNAGIATSRQRIEEWWLGPDQTSD